MAHCTEADRNRLKLFKLMRSRGVESRTAANALRMLKDAEVTHCLDYFTKDIRELSGFNPLLKARVLRMYTSEMPVSEITEQTGIYDATIYMWAAKQKLPKGKATAKCPVCGAEFEKAMAHQAYCSHVCEAKANKHTYNIRRRAAKTEQITDRTITVKGLYHRDKGICWLCGEQCDTEDYIERDGVFIAGDRYPSVDHVVPLAKGGKHSWENVRLAHRICNTLKGDRLLYESEAVEEQNQKSHD